MTLSRQLFLAVFLTLFGLFAGMSYFTLVNTQKFLQYQLTQNAQNTANLLGLSLSTSLKNDDLDSAKRISHVLFGSGYYQNIKMVSGNGVVLIDLVNKQDAYDVPDWFENLVKINPPIKEAVISDGVTAFGKVFVQCHPGYAHEQIFENMQGGLYWLICITFLVMTVGYFILYVLLRPLREIKKQAKLMAKKQFYVIKFMPWASDLKAVVVAMNHLSIRLSKLFDRQQKLAKYLQEKAYHDTLTGLKNTFWLRHKFYQLRKSGEACTGLFALLELANFKSYNNEFGRVAGDQLLIQTARLLETNFKAEVNPIIARTEGACFAILLLNKTPEDTEIIAAQITGLFKQYTQMAIISSNNIGHVGLTIFDYSEKESVIQKKANRALTQARLQAPNSSVIYHSTQQEEETKLKTDTQWKKTLERCLKENKLSCHFEPIIMYGHSANVYVETLARLHLSENNVLPAREWIHEAKKCRLIHSVDLMIFSRVIEKVKSEFEKNKFYFINLSSDTLLKPLFLEDMLSRLSGLGQLKENLIIEMSEYDLLQYLTLLKPILEKFVHAGLGLSIDHFGASLNQLHYLQEVMPNYIKIDSSFTQDITLRTENQILVKTFIDIAHSVKAKAIAQNLENKQDEGTLQKLGIDGIMGNIIS